MRILVVEPHPDDAFLSLGWHLEKVWREHDRTILTVFADHRRLREAYAYAKAIEARSMCLELEESKMDTVGQPKLVRPLEEFLTRTVDDWDTIIFPLGLQHIDHLSVSVSCPPVALRYLDTPYQCKQKLADTLVKKAKGLTVESILWPPARKWRHAEEVFKSQSKFFYFNKGLKESLLPEVILK